MYFQKGELFQVSKVNKEKTLWQKLIQVLKLSKKVSQQNKESQQNAQEQSLPQKQEQPQLLQKKQILDLKELKVDRFPTLKEKKEKWARHLRRSLKIKSMRN